MANFEAYQEYQRIEDFEEDSPPGEEDLLVHVPEGLKGTQLSSKYMFQYAVCTCHCVYCTACTCVLNHLLSGL